MNAVRPLLRHELRDSRNSVAGTVAAVAAGALGCVLWQGTQEPEAYASKIEGIVGGAAFAGAWLAGAAAAADAFAHDAATRRIDRHVLLPVPLADVFAAKALAAAVAMPLGLVVALAAALAAAAALPGPSPLSLATDTVPRALLTATYAVPVVATTAFLAVLLEHALGAIVCGVLVCLLLLLNGATAIPRAEWGVGEAEASFAGLALAAVMLVAARHAFVRGPIHLDRRWRRAALGFGAAALLAAPAAVASAAALDWRADVAPGDASAVPVALRLSPDGRRALVLLGNTHAPQTCQAWLTDLDGGNAVRIPGRGFAFDAWDAHGLRLRTSPPGVRHAEARIAHVDAATGRIERTLAPEADARIERASPLTLARTTDGVLVQRVSDGAKWRFDGVERAEVSPDGRFVALVRAGFSAGEGVRNIAVALVPLGAAADLPRWHAIGGGLPRDASPVEIAWDPGSSRITAVFRDVVVAVDAETGEACERRVAGVLAAPWALRARHVIAFVDGSASVVGVRDGSVAAGPWPEAVAAFVRGHETLVAMTPRDGGETIVVDLADGWSARFDAGPGVAFGANVVAPLADGGVVALGPRGLLLRLR